MEHVYRLGAFDVAHYRGGNDRLQHARTQTDYATKSGRRVRDGVVANARAPGSSASTGHVGRSWLTVVPRSWPAPKGPRGRGRPARCRRRYPLVVAARRRAVAKGVEFVGVDEGGAARRHAVGPDLSPGRRIAGGHVVVQQVAIPAARGRGGRASSSPARPATRGCRPLRGVRQAGADLMWRRTAFVDTEIRPSGRILCQLQCAY